MADVYYSCSPFGTADIKTGTPTCTISSGVLTVTTAQTGNIGVGCRITYDTSKVAFISGVTSSTVFSVTTATGGVPTNEGSAVTVNSIAHEYASLSALEAGFTDASHLNLTDLDANTINFWACCYYDHDDNTLDTTAVTIDWTAGTRVTSPTNRFNVLVPNGGTLSINNNRHAGIYDATKWVLDVPTGGDGIQVEQACVWFDGLQLDWEEPTVYYGGIDYQPGSAYGASNTRIQNVLFQGNGNRAHALWFQTAGTSSVGLVRNCVLYDLAIGSQRSFIKTDDADWTVEIINNTLEGGGNGVVEAAGTTNLYNNAVFNNTDDFNGVAGTMNYNASDDGDGSNAIAPASSNWANEFTNYSTNDYTNTITGNVFEGSPLTNADDSNIPTVDVAANDRNTAGATNTTIGAFADGEVTGGANLTGTITAGATVSGALTATGLITGSISAGVTPTGNLKATGLMAGSIVAGATVSGNLVGISKISGTISAGVAVSGNLGAQSLGGLAGAIDASIAVTGNLGATSTISITGSINAGIALSGSLTGINTGITSGGTTGWQPEKKKKKKKKELTEEEVKGMEAIYRPVPLKEEVITEELEVYELVDLIEEVEPVITEDVIEVDKPIELLERPQVIKLPEGIEVSEEVRELIKEDDDIGLILAIIEAIN